MNEECLICGAPLVYLTEDIEMECAVCHRKFSARTRCVNGHYVCDSCHRQGLDEVLGLCLSSVSQNPLEIIQQLMRLPGCHMHGPEHHVLVGAALLTAYRNAGGRLELEPALRQMRERGREVPGGSCGFWGACGAGISTGMFVSIVTQATPLTREPWGLANRMTAQALAAIGSIGGPRCCKRDSFLAIREAVDFAAEHLGVQMEKGEVSCTFSALNNQCIGSRCPFCAV